MKKLRLRGIKKCVCDHACKKKVEQLGFMHPSPWSQPGLIESKTDIGMNCWGIRN